MVEKKIEIFTNARLSPTPYLHASKFFVLFAAGGAPSAVVSKVSVSKQGRSLLYRTRSPRGPTQPARVPGQGLHPPTPSGRPATAENDLRWWQVRRCREG